MTLAWIDGERRSGCPPNELFGGGQRRQLVSVTVPSVDRRVNVLDGETPRRPPDDLFVDVGLYAKCRGEQGDPKRAR
jgi:hypothetical protein